MNMEAVNHPKLCFLFIELQDVRAQNNVVFTTTLMTEVRISFENLVDIYQINVSQLKKS
jgi:hypothetical protein